MIIQCGLKIHLLENGEVVVFSRNSENMSAKYPDLIESAPKVGVILRSAHDRSLIYPSLTSVAWTRRHILRHR